MRSELIVSPWVWIRIGIGIAAVCRIRLRKHTKAIVYTTERNGDALPGYRKKSFALPYAGGEIWFEHLDGIYQYDDLACRKLQADTPFLLRPCAPSHIAFVLNETTVSETLFKQISEILTCSSKHFFRVALIGADRLTQHRLKKQLKGAALSVGFFEDTEKAKEWLWGVAAF